MNKKRLDSAIAIASSILFLWFMWWGAFTASPVENEQSEEVSATTFIEGSESMDNAYEETAMVPNDSGANNSLSVNASAENASWPKIARVVRVIDGDTFVASVGGSNVTVRMIGIDTPETVHPSISVQCFGKEASERLASLINQKSVVLSIDPTQGVEDKYGRLLAYAYLPNGQNVNELMIHDGYAFEYTYNIPYTLQSSFLSAENFARTNGRGLWAEGVCTPETSSRTNLEMN